MSGRPPSEKPASAAAMDALDLDDLFLEGDDGPSLFADMEIDLGNMGAIFDAPGGATAGGSGPAVTSYNQRGGGDVLTQEFGQPISSSAASNRGKRVRTAKTNPHLAARQQDGGNESAQKRQSAIQKELQRLQDSNDSSLFGDPTSTKRKRRRSKKNQDDEEPNKEAESATGKVATKKKRRSSSKTNTQQMDDLPQSQQPHLQQQQQALQQIFYQMNPQEQERLQKKAEAMGLDIFESSENSTTPQSQLQSNLIKKQEKISDFGLQSSTSFYPYCTLPPELDIKRGLKTFPALEKINATSAPSSHHHHVNTDSNFDDDQSLYSSASATITASGPLYTLFNQHLCLIQNSDRGISDLVEAVKLTHATLKRGGKKKVYHELSKLLTQCLRQSGFIKQNLSNLEGWVKGGGGRWSEAEIHSVFPDHKTAGGTPAAAVTNNADALPLKRGTANDASPNVTPTISVKVKVRVSGWREKSGAKLTARLWCPSGWNAAMNREKLKAGTKKAMTNAPSPMSTTTTKSTASRKRKVKESAASTSTTNKGDVVANQGSLSKIAVPFVSAHQDDQQNQQETTTKQNQEHQDASILHNLYTKILLPSRSPAQRRELLANEISSTLSRLENARLTNQWTKARKLQGQMKASQSVYNDDIDIVPDMCNTIGMWRWMEHTNYFKEIEGKDEVYQELEDCLHEEEEDEAFESKGSVVLEEGAFWGRGVLSEKRRISTAVSDASEDKEKDEMNDHIESSPLFDRLQSLLVEVDDGDDEKDDDNDLISSLPEFSSDQFINGPAGDDNNGDDKEMIDVSALTLDQRTYIQLRAVGLIDATTPPSSVPNTAFSSASTNDNEHGDSIVLVLKQMQLRLSNLQSENNNVKVRALQRKALLQVKQAPERKLREREEDAVLTKYKQLQKMQM